MTADTNPCPAAVTALLRVVDTMRPGDFLRAFALGYVTNVASPRRIERASARALRRILVREVLDQGGEEEEEAVKERELRAAAICAVCEKPIGASGLPFFWRLRIERHGIKADAVLRQTGLEMMLGGAVALAQAMGPDEEMTEPVMDPVTVTVCESCGMKQVMVAVLALENKA